MRRIFDIKKLPNAINVNHSHKNVDSELVAYVYAQAEFALAASLFCAILVFVGLFPTLMSNAKLYIWFGFYLSVTFARLALIKIYKHQHFPQQNYILWRNLYTLGAVLGGLSWGFAAILLPIVNPLEKVFIVLMLAGVTAGAVPLTIGMVAASTLFLLGSVIPFLIYFVMTMQHIFLLFAGALTLYIIYSIVLTLRGTQTIKKSIELQYENAELLQNLSDAKYQLELSNEKLEYAATHDPLTRLVNRNLFEVNLEQMIHNAKIKQQMFALFYLDLDRFKHINDKYGHYVGDTVLVFVANRLIRFFQDKENIARLGGEEFTILVKDINSINRVKHIANELCKVIAEPMVLKNIDPIRVTASIGVSIYPIDGLTSTVLLTQADNSMYYAKEHGGNHFYFGKEYV